MLFVSAFVWMLPWMVLVYIAGWLSHARPWPALKHWRCWEWLRVHYFHFEVDGDLPLPQEKVIYAIYPHGHYSITATFYWALNPVFSDARAAVHSILFWIPVFGSFVRWIDAIPVVEDEMVRVLQSGTSIYMCPGGIADITNTGNTITRRSGFFRVAREAGADVIPIWCPVERSYYSHWKSPLVPFIVTWGLWWFPFLPNGASFSPIRVGKRIDPRKEGAEDEFWCEMARLQK